jgi:hypothetical protein
VKLALGLLIAVAACGGDPGVIAPDASTLVFTPPSAAEPFWLSSTGLYRDLAAKQLAPELLEFEPAFALWSDGAVKRRWLRLPAASRIDTSSMDHWQFPVGSVLWKEFSLEGRRLETRVLARTGPEPRDTWMGAFVWNEDESDARFVPDGERDVRGTTHDVPSAKQCGTCHNGEAGRVLGFSAVQQPSVDATLLTRPAQQPFNPPGDRRTANALGYLHANCAHCHNPSGSARPDTDMNLRLSVSESNAAETNALRTTIGRSLQSFTHREQSLRVAPGSPEQSGVLARMEQRDADARMPPLGTEEIDARGIEIVRTWIDAM